MKDNNKEERFGNSVGKGLEVAGVAGLGMYGAHKLDKQLNLAEHINAGLGIKRQNESLTQKIGRKAANVVGGAKPDEEIGKFNFYGKLKNKIKKKFVREDVATLRGSDEFIKPHQEIIDNANNKVKDLNNVLSDLEAKGQGNSKTAQEIKGQINSIIKDSKVANAHNEVNRLNELKNKGRIAKKYATGMNWVRDNWSSNGLKGKAKVAAIPLGIGATVGGVNHLINKARKTDKRASERTYSEDVVYVDPSKDKKKHRSNAIPASALVGGSVILGTGGAASGAGFGALLGKNKLRGAAVASLAGAIGGSVSAKRNTRKRLKERSELEEKYNKK